MSVNESKKLLIDAYKLIQHANKLMADSYHLKKSSLELSRYARKNIDKSKRLLLKSDESHVHTPKQ